MPFEINANLPGLLNTFLVLFNGDDRRIFSLTGAIHCCQEMCHSDTPPSLNVCLDLLRKSFEYGTPLTKTDALLLLRSVHRHVMATCSDRVEKITEVLQSLDNSDPFMNTEIMEALAMYDALEPIVSVEDAAAEFRKFISPSADFLNDIDEYRTLYPELASEDIRASGAYSAIGRIFEDIFQGAYWEAYELLSDDEKAKLLCLAANEQRSGFYKDWIFAELLRLSHPSSVNVFRRFARTFDSGNPFPNESISTFIMSMLGCSRFLEDLPDMHCGDRIDERAWLLIGKIIFWHERRQKDELRARQQLRELWALAQDTVAPALPDVLRHIHLGAPQHLVPNPPDLVRAYPEEIRPILEKALRDRGSMTSLWLNPGVTNRDAIYFTISALSQIGDRKSADVIETLADDPLFGEDAVRAVRVLRGLHQN